MITFTSFIEIFTTLIFCITLTMLAVILAQVIHSFWRNRTMRKRRFLYFHERQKAELEQSKQLIISLKADCKLVAMENKHLNILHEAFREELRFYSNLHSERVSYCMKLESQNFKLQCRLSGACQQIRLLKENIIELETSQQQVEVLDISSQTVFQAKGVSIEELTELPQIMQGTSQSSDLDAAIIVAKTSGTVLFEQLQEQIKESGQHIGSLIDRIDKRMDNSNGITKNMETYFYNNTGFSIRDFLPQKAV